MAKKNNNGKSSVPGMVISVILFTAIVVVLVVVNAGIFFGQPKNLYDEIAEKGEPVKGDYVELEANMILGEYAETEYRIQGIIPAGKVYHYVAMLNDGSVISISFRGKKLKEEIDKIVSNTESFYMTGDVSSLGDSVTLKGKLETVAGEQGTYYTNALFGYYDGEIYRVSIDTTVKGSMLIFVIIFAVIDIGCIIGLVAAIKEKKKQSQMPTSAPEDIA